MRSPLLGALLWLTVATPGAKAAWRRVVLVELFTSQGCSSCPPADAFVRELPALGLGRDKVLPLTFHVDYWDGLGWKDPFATPAFTERQRWYARATAVRPAEGGSGLEGVYTPEMIVDGATQFSGGRRELGLHEMSRAGALAPLFDLSGEVSLKAQTVTLAVRVTPRAPVDERRDWRLFAALAARAARTSVQHGENAGETLEEASVVRALSDPIPLSRARAGATIPIQLTKPAGLPWPQVQLVAFVQSRTTGEIGAATDLKP